MFAQPRWRVLWMSASQVLLRLLRKVRDGSWSSRRPQQQPPGEGGLGREEFAEWIRHTCFVAGDATAALKTDSRAGKDDGLWAVEVYVQLWMLMVLQALKLESIVAACTLCADCASCTCFCGCKVGAAKEGEKRQSRRRSCCYKVERLLASSATWRRFFQRSAKTAGGVLSENPPRPARGADCV